MRKYRDNIQIRTYLTLETQNLLKKTYISYIQRGDKQGRSFFLNEAIKKLKDPYDIKEELICTPINMIIIRNAFFLEPARIKKVDKLRVFYEYDFTVPQLLNAILYVYLQKLDALESIKNL